MVRAAVAMINSGNPLRAVAMRLGVDRTTLRLYLRVTRTGKRKGQRGTWIEEVEPVWPTQPTATPTATPAPYVRGYRW